MTASSARPSSASDREAALRLGPAQVHLWLRSRSATDDSGTFLRRLLSRYADVSPEQWCFREGEHGRPELVDPPLPLSFNLSHSGDWIVCAVSAGVPVGVDIERVEGRRDVLRLARRFYHADETAELEQFADKQAQRARFYDYWTLKEAAVKARGLPLGPALEHVTFTLHIEHGQHPMPLRADLQPDENPASYWLLDPLPGYRLALCLLAAERGVELLLDGPGSAGMEPVPAAMWRARPAQS